ncbi:reverse transcriptase domain-containing protein [Tanacetum coccineum]
MADLQSPEEEVGGTNSKDRGTGPRKGSNVPLSLDPHHPPSTFINKRKNMLKTRREKPNEKLVQRIYVDEGSSSEVMYEHCFRSLGVETKARLRDSRTPLVGFSGEVNYAMGFINLNVTMGEPGKLQMVTMEFTVVKRHSPYNVILGRTDLRSLGVVASTIHSMIKFPMNNGIEETTKPEQSSSSRPGREVIHDKKDKEKDKLLKANANEIQIQMILRRLQRVPPDTDGQER